MDSKLQEQWPKWRIGDAITQIQHQSIRNFADGMSLLHSTPNTPITLTVGGQEYPILIQKTKLSESKSYPSIGIELTETRMLVHTNPFRQIQQGIQTTILTLGSFMAPTSDVHFKNMMGPPGILDALHTSAQYDLRFLLWLVIIININLAVFNLLPIPILDGGIIALTLFEAIFRRKIAIKLLAGIQLTFMCLFLGLILYVSFFDINRILEKQDQEKQSRRQLQLIVDEQLLWNGLSISHVS
jgi:regulator of sigma E protease